MGSENHSDHLLLVFSWLNVSKYLFIIEIYLNAKLFMYFRKFYIFFNKKKRGPKWNINLE